MAGLPPKNLCEACRKAPVEVLIESMEPDQPFRLCNECGHRLEAHSLRPLEWFNLAALHSPMEYYLDSDFYWDNGVAQQPHEEVISPDAFPAPTLDDVAHDLDRLIDYAMTLHAMEDEVAIALAQHDEVAILAALRSRVSTTHNVEIERRAYEICAAAVGEVAAPWIRERWGLYQPRGADVADVLFLLAQASAKCLPFDEAFDLVAQGLERVPSEYYPSLAISLALFRSQRALDWLETHVRPPLVCDWGRLAALSRLSWSRVSSWLDSGRPLSLVALDALNACWNYNTNMLEEVRPKLVDPPAEEIMIAALEEYARRDPVPRVEQNVSSILAHLAEIRGSEIPDSHQ